MAERKPTLLFEAEGHSVTVNLDLEAAPRTLRAILERLPMRVDLHCAKIAGDQILFPVPVVMPLEGAMSINAIPRGAFIYYPDRQFCELMYGDLQDEEASVTYLGEAGEGLRALRYVGERVQREQGSRIIRGRLSFGSLAWVDGFRRAVDAMDPDPAYADLPGADALPTAPAEARAEWQAILEEPPAEIMALLRRRGVMLPVGPLLVAESEARKLHESLWGLRTRAAAVRERRLHSTAEASAFVADAGAVLLRLSEDRLANFAGLHECGGFLGRMAAHMEKSTDDALTLLDELIVYSGRLAGWLDQGVPWHAVNEAAARSSEALAR